MSTARKIGILLILGGLLLPVIGLGFVKGYNPVLGFVGSLPRMEIIYGSEPDPNRSLRDLLENGGMREKTIPYGYVFALGCILVCLGTAGVLFNQQSNIPKEQAQNEGQNSPPETPVDLPEE